MYYESKIVLIPKKLYTPIAIGVALVSALIVGLSVAYYLLNANTGKIQDKIGLQASAIESLTKQKASLDTVLTRYESLVDKFNKVLFKEKDVSLFLTGISDLSRKNNVNVVSIRNLTEEIITIRDTEKGQQGAQAIFSEEGIAVPVQERTLQIVISPFQVEIEGELDNVLAVLSSLERTPQLLAISQFEFTLKKYPRISVKFQINLYGSWKEGIHEQKG